MPIPNLELTLRHLRTHFLIGILKQRFLLFAALAHLASYLSEKGCMCLITNKQWGCEEKYESGLGSAFCLSLRK